MEPQENYLIFTKQAQQLLQNIPDNKIEYKGLKLDRLRISSIVLMILDFHIPTDFVVNLDFIKYNKLIL